LRVTILNGNPNAENKAFDQYLKELSDSLISNNHSVNTLQLRDMDIRYCIGCFGCFDKTPGECSTAADDSREVRREYINSDFVLFASPIIMGYTSALLKKPTERNLGLLLPYGEIAQEETHHPARYDKYPQLGLLLEKNSDSDNEDVEIISDMYMRDAINFHATLCFTKLTSDPIKEVVDEINSI
jgi:multimeric flavodoxin WrbA